MTSTIQRALSYVPALPSFSSVARTTAPFLRRSFSFLSHPNTLTAMKGVTLAALGYNVTRGTPFYRSYSAAALFAIYSAPWLLKKGAAQILKCLPRNWGLLIALMKGDQKLIEEMIRLGATGNERLGRGILFHLACTRSTPEVVQRLLVQGARIDTVDLHGETALHYACRANQPEIAKILLASGANPFILDRNGSSPIRLCYLLENVHMLRILTGTENHRAFQGCRTVYDFLSILFPPSTQRLPPNWQQTVSRFPPSAELVELQREAERITLSRTQEQRPSLNDLAEQINREFSEPSMVYDAEEANRAFENRGDSLHNFWESVPEAFMKGMRPYRPGDGSRLPVMIWKLNYASIRIEALLTKLLQASPLFAKAWELANRKQKIVLENAPYEAFQNADGSVSARARYDITLHRIQIYKNLTASHKLKGLIFETINALQRSTFQRISGLANANGIRREDFALLYEWIENYSLGWRTRILRELGENIPDVSFEESWDAQNALPSEEEQRNGEISHTDHYRRSWDRLHFFKYLSRNPDFLRRRLEELACEADSSPSRARTTSL